MFSLFRSGYLKWGAEFRRVKEAIDFAKPYQPDAFLAVGEFNVQVWGELMLTMLQVVGLSSTPLS